MEISELISKGMDYRLPFWEKAQVRMHFLICKACQRVERQFGLMKTAAGNLDRAVEDDEILTDEKLSDETKARIRDKLKGGG